MYSYLQQCQRTPCVSSRKNRANVEADSPVVEKKFALWRLLAADFHFVDSAKQTASNFARDVRHLDQTCARELHKIAVIYVAKGQEVSSCVSNCLLDFKK